MPIFKEYADSYEKDGYYVHAPISGLDHPIPLQTPPVTERIYKELGYSDGDHVPNELAWNLYDAGLHWTESTGPQGRNKSLSVEDLADASPPLTDDDIKTINELLENYRGRYQNEVSTLREQLDENLNDQSSNSETRELANPPAGVSDLDLNELQTSVQSSVERIFQEEEFSFLDSDTDPAVLVTDRSEEDGSFYLNITIGFFLSESFDNEYFHTGFDICEEHGLERWSWETDANINWAIRTSLYRLVDPLLFMLVLTLSNHDIDPGSPRTLRDPEIRPLTEST